jgi:hypothetical protein
VSGPGLGFALIALLNVMVPAPLTPGPGGDLPSGQPDLGFTLFSCQGAIPEG